MMGTATGFSVRVGLVKTTNMTRLEARHRVLAHLSAGGAPEDFTVWKDGREITTWARRINGEYHIAFTGPDGRYHYGVDK